MNNTRHEVTVYHRPVVKLGIEVNPLSRYYPSSIEPLDKSIQANAPQLVKYTFYLPDCIDNPKVVYWDEFGDKSQWRDIPVLANNRDRKKRRIKYTITLGVPTADTILVLREDERFVPESVELKKTPDQVFYKLVIIAEPSDKSFTFWKRGTNIQIDNIVSEQREWVE